MSPGYISREAGCKNFFLTQILGNEAVAGGRRASLRFLK